MNTATSTPRFRSDLVTQPIDAEGQRFVDVTDPDSGRTFRFYEVEYAIACAMDGRRDVGGLAAWALEELGLETTPTELETVITTLDELGYLEVAAVGAGPVELGTPGVVTPRVEAPVDIAADDLELGAPGRSPIARERPAPGPSANVELGASGSPIAADQPAGLSAPGGADDQSFEGLLDDEPPTKVRPAPVSPQSAEDAQTAVRRGAAAEADFGDLEGLTPPPAEVPTAHLRPSTEPASDDDGPTNLPPPAPGLEPEELSPEVSVDLSEHLSMDVSDVKEAVRQSQVMQAVDVPQDLLDEIAGSKAAAPAAEPAPSAAEPIELAAERPKVSKPKAAKAGEAKPAVEPPEPAPAPAPKKGTSPVLIFLFIAVLAGGGAYWYFMIYKKGQEKDEAGTAAGKPGVTQPVGPTDKPPAPQPPPKPAAVALTEKAVEPVSVAMTTDGVLSWLVDDGAEVAAGDPVAKIKGAERIEGKIRKVTDRRAQYEARRDRAKAAVEAAGDSATAKQKKDLEYLQGKVDSKTKLIEEHEAELVQYEIRAESDGAVKVLAQVGKYVKAGVAIAEIGGGTTLVAALPLPAGKTVAAGDTVAVVLETAPDKAIDCTALKSEGGKVVVECSADSGLAAGSKILLK